MSKAVAQSLREGGVGPDLARMLSFGIVNYRTASYLPPLLQSLAQHHEPGSFEVIVVDNASGDALAEVLRPFPFARLVQSARNDGFGAGMNQAFAASRGDWFVSVNPDVVFHGSIAPVVATRAAEVAAVAVATRTQVGGDIEAHGGDILRLRNAYGRKRVSAAAIAVARGEETDVEWASAAVFAVRRTVFAAVRGFDERYFMYYEDVDLCRRIGEAGLGRIVWSPAPVVVHAVGGAPLEHSRRKAVAYRSQRRYWARWGHPLVAGALVPVHAVLLWWMRRREHSA